MPALNSRFATMFSAIALALASLAATALAAEPKVIEEKYSDGSIKVRRQVADDIRGREMPNGLETVYFQGAEADGNDLPRRNQSRSVRILRQRNAQGRGDLSQRPKRWRRKVVFGKGRSDRRDQLSRRQAERAMHSLGKWS